MKPAPSLFESLESSEPTRLQDRPSARRPHARLVPLRDRGATAIGLLCLIATLWLLPVGVRTVQAGDVQAGDVQAGKEEPPASRVSIDPTLVEAVKQQARRLGPERPLPAAQEGREPAAPGDELAPGDRVLNPRGYNYDSVPTELGPEALDLERLRKR